jgi:hypothetical protein
LIVSNLAQIDNMIVTGQGTKRVYNMLFVNNEHRHQNSNNEQGEERRQKTATAKNQ